jgi:hypothetical protein
VTDEDTPGVRRAWGWVEHLRAGGTTPWRDWSGTGPAGGRILAGAQQLELLRRLNEVGHPGPRLVERVLAASAPGRGRPDLELAGAVARPRFGPPPVDPADLPDDELLRVAANLLAEDVVAAGPAPETTPGWVRPWRTRYRLLGDPALADPWRAELVARGRPPGDRAATVLVLGTDLGRMLADVWEHRCFGDGGAGWRRWLDALARRDALPPRADLLRIAETWSGRRGRVVVVLDPAAVPRLVGVRRLAPPPGPVAADAADLARRVAAVLGLLVPPHERHALLQGVLRPRLAAVPGPAPVLPAEHRDWAHARAVRLRDDLLRAGYAVHGDPDALLPRDLAGAAEPSDAGVLGLALRMLLDQGAPATPADLGKETTT